MIMNRFFSVVTVLVAVGAGAAACSTSNASSSTSSATKSTAASAVVAKPGYTALTRSLHKLATPEADIGRVESTKPQSASIVLKPSAKQVKERDQLLKDIQDPKSPKYQHWLKPEEIAAKFGPAKKDVDAVSDFLRGNGLKVEGVSHLGNRITFSGSTAQVEKTFSTELHNYSVNGKTYFAMSKAPQVPNAIAKSVMGVHGLHSFHAQPHLVHPKPRPEFDGGKTYGFNLAPADFAALYNTAPLVSAGTDGTGITVAIIGQTLYKTSTVNPVTNWRKKFGFSNTNITTDVLVPGTGTSQINDADNEGETLLDLEWQGGVAPGSNQLFVYTGSNTDNYSVNDAVNYVVDMGPNLPGSNGKGAQIISESYGSCEAAYLPADADIDSEVAAAANLEGITYLAASGDSGAAGCAEFGIGGIWTGPPASLPGVLAVGGNEFNATAQADTTAFNTKTDTVLGYPVDSSGNSLEAIWDDHEVYQGTLYFGAGGGGVSQIFAKPYWQEGITPADGHRDVPDVSLTASADYLGYYINGPDPNDSSGKSYAYYPIGGTSASTPSFAGILALVEQAVVAKGGPLGLGNVSPALYNLSKSNPTAFHDVVTGNNDGYCDTDKSDQSYDPNCPTAADSSCTATADLDCPASGNYGGYKAHAGYDLASGLGSVDANALVQAWSVLTPTTTTLASSATSTAQGSPVTLTATVTRKTAGTTPLAGKVTFAFQTFAGSAGTVYAGDAGGYDDSWVLGTADIVANGETGGTAVLSTLLPPGLQGSANVVAEYDGDPADLSSVSAQQTIAVTGSTLKVTPSTITLQPGATTTFVASGNNGGVAWGEEGTDTTCYIDQQAQEEECSEIAAQDQTHGFFKAGGQAGTVTIVAVDGYGAEATVVVTVAGTPVDGGPFPTDLDAGPVGPGNGPTTTFDAGPVVIDASTDDASTGDDSGLGDDDDAGDDTGTTTVDAGKSSGNGDSGSSSSSGCAVAPSHTTSSSDMLGLGVLFGLVSLARSKKRKSA